MPLSIKRTVQVIIKCDTKDCTKQAMVKQPTEIKAFDELNALGWDFQIECHPKLTSYAWCPDHAKKITRKEPAYLDELNAEKKLEIIRKEREKRKKAQERGKLHREKNHKKLKSRNSGCNKCGSADAVDGNLCLNCAKEEALKQLRRDK